MKTNIRVNVETVKFEPPTDKQVADFFEAENILLRGKIGLGQAIIDSGQTLIEAYRREYGREIEKVKFMERALIPAAAITGIILGVCAVRILECFIK